MKEKVETVQGETPDKKKERRIKIPVKLHSSSFSDPLLYKILSDEMVNFTEEMAYKFLELEVFPGERPVRELHVQFLADEWTAGRFLWQNVILASAVLNGKEYRMNGQHCSWMRVNLPKRVEPLKAEVRRMVYQVNSMDQMRAMYSAFDRNATRSTGHVSKVMLMDTEAGREIPSSYITNLVAGFRLYWTPGPLRRNTVNPNEVIGIITKNYPQLFNLVGCFLKIHYEDSRWIKRAAVLAGMFATFEKNVKSSDEFWSAICSGIGLNEKNDPRWQLRRFIEEHGHTAMSGNNVISAEQLFCTIVRTWNHWRTGGKLERIVTSNERVKARS